MMRRNALAHGMTASHVVLFDEVRSDFEKFYAGLSRDFAPEGTTECALVERIAMLAWRLRRASRAEAAMVNGEAEHRRERIAEDGPHKTRRLDTSIMFDWLVDNMSTLTRYEASIDRQLNRAIAILERLQADRVRRAAREEAEREDRPLQESESVEQSQFAEGNQRQQPRGEANSSRSDGMLTLAETILSAYSPGSN